MNVNPNPSHVTDFTSDWIAFEQRLSRFLGDLAKPTLQNVVRLHYPTADDSIQQVTLRGMVAEKDCVNHAGDGVQVELRGEAAHFYGLRDEAEEIPDAAHDVCKFLRESAQVAHPGLLATNADTPLEFLLRLELPDVSAIVRELAEPRRTRRGQSPGISELSHGMSEKPFPEVVFPESAEELREAVESVLMAKYSSVDIDTDGDYRIDHPFIGGTRFYVTLLDDRPLIRIWKTIISGVNSRRSATIEANYLNRVHPLTKWVLWGHDLVQEVYVPGGPFTPHIFEEMLECFTEQHIGNLSALQLRLGAIE